MDELTVRIAMSPSYGLDASLHRCQSKLLMRLHYLFSKVLKYKRFLFSIPNLDLYLCTGLGELGELCICIMNSVTVFCTCTSPEKKGGGSLQFSGVLPVSKTKSHRVKWSSVLYNPVDILWAEGTKMAEFKYN